MADQIIWRYKCGHDASQTGTEELSTPIKAQSDGSVYWVQLGGSLQSLCPTCTVVEQQASEAKRRKEEMEKGALAAYQAQADFIKKQIEAAKQQNNADLVKNLRTTLTTCTSLWADIVKRKEGKTSAEPVSPKSATFARQIDTAIDKLTLLRDVQDVTSTRLYGKTALKDRNARRESIMKTGEWAKLIHEMERIAADYEANVKANLEGVEKAYEETWAKALELMKEK